jgi:chemotaxis methyl-accepting protein methylase
MMVIKSLFSPTVRNSIVQKDMKKALTLLSPRFARRWVGRPYIAMSALVWSHLPAGLRYRRAAQAYGLHLHGLTRLRGSRTVPAVTTFFFRNRPLLELLIRLLSQRPQGASVTIAVIGCSKGAEVYSIIHALRRARPDLTVNVSALDVSRDIVDFAKAGVYSLASCEPSGKQDSEYSSSEVPEQTFKDQPSSMFERVASSEMNELFDRRGNCVKIKPFYRRGITWYVADARDVTLTRILNVHDVVFANNFLCHLSDDDAESCLRNLARLVKPSGYIFVSGADLDIRSKIARELGWQPVKELMKEIHEGDPSLCSGWPLQRWGLEPFNPKRPDWQTRYAAVFSVPETGSTARNSADAEMETYRLR